MLHESRGSCVERIIYTEHVNPISPLRQRTVNPTNTPSEVGEVRVEGCQSVHGNQGLTSFPGIRPCAPCTVGAAEPSWQVLKHGMCHTHTNLYRLPSWYWSDSRWPRILHLLPLMQSSFDCAKKSCETVASNVIQSTQINEKFLFI